MRICHIIEAGAAGAGNVVLDLARAGVEAGDEITVIYGTERTWPQFVQTLTDLKKVKLIATPMQRAVGAHDLKDGYQLFKALRSHGPFDVLHAHSSKAGALLRLLRFFFPKSVVVYTPHAFVTMAPDASPAYGWIEWLLSWLCDAIICVSEQEKLHAQVELRIPAQKLQVIPNGVDLKYPYDRIAARARLQPSDSDFIVGFVGRLEAQKNPARAVDAFCLAAAKNPALHLVIIGQGALQSAAEHSLAARGLKDRARFITDFNGRALIAGFDCLLCSSDYESFGLVILEALAGGVPVVTTPVGIAEDAVLSGKTGRVTDFHPASQAKAILEIADSTTEQRAQMVVDARTQAQKFGLETMAGKTRMLYEHLRTQKIG